MADPVIDWSTDPENPNNHTGTVGGVQYFSIYPRYGWDNHALFSAVPNPMGLSTYGDVEDLKLVATEILSKFVTMTHSQMVIMGLLTE